MEPDITNLCTVCWSPLHGFAYNHSGYIWSRWGFPKEMCSEDNLQDTLKNNTK